MSNFPMDGVASLAKRQEAESNPQLQSHPIPASKKTVPEMLKEMAELYRQRNKVYGDNYKLFGHCMAILEEMEKE